VGVYARPPVSSDGRDLCTIRSRPVANRLDLVNTLNNCLCIRSVLHGSEPDPNCPKHGSASPDKTPLEERIAENLRAANEDGWIEYGPDAQSDVQELLARVRELTEAQRRILMLESALQRIETVADHHRNDSELMREILNVARRALERNR